MKRQLLAIFVCFGIMATGKLPAQTLKVGVFDIDLMVQAMPEYEKVDSLVQDYERDSLSAEYQYYLSEYQRLDSTYKSDSALVASGQGQAARLTFITEERRKMGLNIVYWQQIAQNKSNIKRSRLAQPLYQQVSEAYRKILAARKYNLILKPNTYEGGFAIENIFLSVARELKLGSLPQELIYLGDDPDATKAPTKPPVGAKPKP